MSGNCVECPYFSPCEKEVWGTLEGNLVYRRGYSCVCIARLDRTKSSGLVIGPDGKKVYDFNQVGCDLSHSDGEKFPDFYNAEYECRYFPK
jgi:hypothetical protein